MNLTKVQKIKMISDLLDIKNDFNYFLKEHKANEIIDRVIKNLLEVM